MSTDPYWNHNTHYHPWILEQVPAHARTALDIGCGDGLLASKLATRCDAVLGVDLDGAALATAAPAPNVHFEKADFRDLDDTFDMVTAVATLHHVPLREGLTALRHLVAPGGTLAVVGLWKLHPLTDFAYLPLLLGSWATNRRHRDHHPGPTVTVRDPEDPFPDIRAATREFLPGAQLHRRLLWRYTLLWHRPR
ncbi:class I SAM-dependent methyltransferase [Nocardia sp. NPDC059177]|uniref:class I SAM-dependent methyltransferase n=1 Tax=Nocardia sp. NPDC059177 TaxID=3346759 RepID=UPI0036A0E72F